MASTACSLENAGQTPDESTLNFPVDLQVSLRQCGGAPCQLFVLNSNFDLKYNRGSIQSYDLAKLHASMANCERPCSFDPTEYLASNGEVFIESYGSSLDQNPEGNRLYASVRGGNVSLTYVDLDSDGGLFCDQTSDKICNDPFVITGNSQTSLPLDPVTLGTGALSELDNPSLSGNYILTAHGGGQIALFIEEQVTDSAPQLISVASGLSDLISNMFIDHTQPLAYVVNRQDQRIDRVGIAFAEGDPRQSFLFAPKSVGIHGLSDNRDLRDLYVDAEKEQLWFVTRNPNALVKTRLEGSNMFIERVFPLDFGPSRLQVRTLPSLGTRVAFVSCYDSRKLFVFDLDHEVLLAMLPSFSGPFAVEVDPARNYLYVADFSSSVLRLVDLSPLAAGMSLRISGTIGQPTRTRELL